MGTLRGHKDKVSLAEQDPDLFDLPRPGEHHQVVYERVDAIADAGFMPDATISVEILRDIAVISRYLDVFVICPNPGFARLGIVIETCLRRSVGLRTAAFIGLRRRCREDPMLDDLFALEPERLSPRGGV